MAQIYPVKLTFDSLLAGGYLDIATIHRYAAYEFTHVLERIEQANSLLPNINPSHPITISKA